MRTFLVRSKYEKLKDHFEVLSTTFHSQMKKKEKKKRNTVFGGGRNEHM